MDKGDSVSHSVNRFRSVDKLSPRRDGDVLNLSKISCP